jgi:cytoplasmic iron level regulating protein YaaA (DUF328/UPF0246 family)
MDISEDLANLNHQRFNMWEFDHSNVNTNKPALFMFNGDVYEGINPQSLDIKQIEKAQNHLKILSGLYGIINPLDNMQAYRLEMGTKLEFDIKQKPSLYKFWSDTQTDYIINEFSQNAYLQKLPKVIINLASDEYFKVINTKKLIQNDIKIIKINFEQNKNGIYKNISFLTKYARGLMVRFILQNDIKSITDLHKFNLDGYTYSESLSDSQNLYFRKS